MPDLKKLFFDIGTVAMRDRLTMLTLLKVGPVNTDVAKAHDIRYPSRAIHELRLAGYEIDSILTEVSPDRAISTYTLRR